MDEIKKYIDNIVKLINTEVANIAERCGVLVRKGATIASYDSATKKATVYFDGDSSTESAPYYNKSGHTLEVGQRVYIFHLFGNPSQGWIMMRAGAYPDDESGSGGGLDGIDITGSGNAVTTVSLSDNILTFTKGNTFVADNNYVHTDNNYTTTEKNKLSGIASGAEVNQNAFSNVVVGNTTVAADSKTDTLTLEAGGNITLTPDATNDKITIATSGLVTGVKGSEETNYRTGNVSLTPANIGAVAKNAELQTTNAFAPPSLRGPYISKIDNAFYAADKRWTVTMTNRGGGSISDLFDGSYETHADVTNGDTSVITMDFTNESSGYFPGYPYGYILVSFYYAACPTSVSGRVYCNYQAQGIGWHDISFALVSDSTTNNIVYRSIHQSYYQISQLEITIVGDTTNSYGRTQVSQIEMHLDRPDPSRNPFLTKYYPETLYYDLTAPKFIGDLQGNADSATVVNGHTVNSDVPANAVFTDTTYDPATATPLMDGTGAVGTSVKYAREDHRHPTDTTRAAASDLSSHTGNSTIHITSTERTNWNNASTNSHTHSNKTVLDGISSTDVSNWNAKQDALTEGTDYLNKTHLDATYVPLTSVGANNGIAELDSTGKVPSSQLPSFVDDVAEYNSRSDFPATGESGKIYIAKDTNLTYRWSGTAYVEISPSLALGETSSTAYRGDRGKIAYDHSQDGTVHVTSTQKTNWNTAYTNTHTHSNKSLLDTYTQTEANLADAVSKKHSHSNKAVLDGISSTDISNWNAKSDFSGDYEDLTNKPQVNSVTLIGNRSLDDLNIQIKGDYADSALTNMEIEALLSAN